MATKSTFYDTAPGQGVKETEWAESALSRGAMYGVIGDALKLSAHPTTPYAVNLSPGKFFGHGVWDELDNVQRVDSVGPANGVLRWDLIAARRDWQPSGGGPTSYVSIRGGSSAAIPSTRENRPGTVDDQPLWLVQWKGGETQPQVIIDLRCWTGPGGLEVAHDLALSYLKYPGAVVKSPSGLNRYARQANGVWDWERVDAGRPTLALSGTDAPAPVMEAGTVTVRTDANGATAIPFKARFPRALNSVFIQHAMAPNLGLIQFRFDEALSNPGRAAFFAFDNAGNRLRNTTGIRVSYLAVGD